MWAIGTFTTKLTLNTHEDETDIGVLLEVRLGDFGGALGASSSSLVSPVRSITSTSLRMLSTSNAF